MQFYLKRLKQSGQCTQYRKFLVNLGESKHICHMPVGHLEWLLGSCRDQLGWRVITCACTDTRCGSWPSGTIIYGCRSSAFMCIAIMGKGVKYINKGMHSSTPQMLLGAWLLLGSGFCCSVLIYFLFSTMYQVISWSGFIWWLMEQNWCNCSKKRLLASRF